MAEASRVGGAVKVLLRRYLYRARHARPPRHGYLAAHVAGDYRLVVCS